MRILCFSHYKNRVIVWVHDQVKSVMSLLGPGLSQSFRLLQRFTGLTSVKRHQHPLLPSRATPIPSSGSIQHSPLHFALFPTPHKPKPLTVTKSLFPLSPFPISFRPTCFRTPMSLSPIPINIDHTVLGVQLIKRCVTRFPFWDPHPNVKTKVAVFYV